MAKTTDQPPTAVIDYARERYVEEQERFSHLEEKCSKFLNTLSIAIGAFVVISGIYFDSTGRPADFVGWLVFASIFLTFAALASAWGNVLAALKIQDYHVPSQGDDAIEFMLNQPDKRDRFILDCYTTTTSKLAEDLEYKEQHLELAYREIVFSGWSVIVSLALIVIQEWVLT